MRETRPQAVGHADVRPLPLTKPAIGLQSDDVQKRNEAAVADHGAGGAEYSQSDIAGFHGAAPELGHPLTSKRTMRPASPCKSAGFNKLSVGFKSMSIQYTLPVRLRSASPGLNPSACT